MLKSVWDHRRTFFSSDYPGGLERRVAAHGLKLLFSEFERLYEGFSREAKEVRLPFFDRLDTFVRLKRSYTLFVC